MTIDKKRAQLAMEEFLRALGHQFKSVEQTAARVTNAYADELLSGYDVDLEVLIREGSEVLNSPADPIVLDQIFTSTVCPHHLLVAQGTALVAYIPSERVLGLGTIARLVNACSRRLVLQEQIATDVVQALMHHGGARGAFCRLTLNHACLQARGANQPHAEATSWCGQGEFSDPRSLELILGRSLRSESS